MKSPSRSRKPPKSEDCLRYLASAPSRQSSARLQDQRNTLVTERDWVVVTHAARPVRKAAAVIWIGEMVEGISVQRGSKRLSFRGRRVISNMVLSLDIYLNPLVNSRLCSL